MNTTSIALFSIPASINDTTLEQHVIKFVINKPELLKLAIKDALHKLRNLLGIRWNTLRAFNDRWYYYNLPCFYGKTRNIDLMRMCCDSFLDQLATHNEFYYYIPLLRLNENFIEAFRRLFRKLLNTVDKNALRESLSLHGEGSHYQRICALQVIGDELVDGLTQSKIIGVIRETPELAMLIG